MAAVEHVMGMGIVVDIRDSDVGRAPVDEVFDWLRFVDETFSVSTGRRISRLERGELALADTMRSAESSSAATSCAKRRADTSTSTCPWQPGNPSRSREGLGRRSCPRILEDAGARNFAIYAGGDVIVGAVRQPRIAGTLASAIPAAQTAWRPSSGRRPRDRHVGRVRERRSRPPDPHTRSPTFSLLSVTITGPDLATADAYATAAFAMGAQGPPWTARLDGYEAMSILESDTVLSTPGFPAVD